MRIALMTEANWPTVEAIYREGIATGHATFATEPPSSWEVWAGGKINQCSLVAQTGDTVLGWAAVSPTSARACYAGVAEHSVYIASAAQDQGVGRALLEELFRVTETAGIWTLQSSIFPANAASYALHLRCGFREVGRRERIALMTYGPFEGRWRDTIILERRSSTVGL